MKVLLLSALVILSAAPLLPAQTEPTVTPASVVTPPPATLPTTTPAVAPPLTTPAPTVSVAPAPTSPNAFADNIRKKAHIKKHGVHIDVGDSSDPTHVDTDGNIPGAVVPILVISVLAVFGTPIAIVAVIMGSSWAKSRSLHKTVRELAAKGQPIPPELIASRAGTPLRPWYDLRRGIIMLAVGTGITFFFLAVAGWDSGVWAFGLIPAIMGAGYIFAWRLAQKQENGFKM